MARRLKRPTRLQTALLFSVLVHAALLAVRFADPEGFNRLMTDTPLEVVLVNARADETPPAKPQAIAQASLAGGGEAEQGRATSPLPLAAIVSEGDDTQQATRQIDRMQDLQQQLLTQVRRELAMLQAPDPARDETPDAQRDREERRQRMLRMLAEIEKRVNDENARPKRRYISPATREEIYAVYYDSLRRKIEDRGTRDFPEVNGQKLYGELTMNVTIDAEGRVVEAEVVRSSRNKALDKRAVAIVHASAPFGPFSTAMRRGADQIVVTSRFRFTRDDGLETSLSVPTP
jgi:periplasmic protein TonB